MAATNGRRIVMTAAAIAAVLAMAGCATRFNAEGQRIYVWQFGQDSDRTIDYSNPRLPILPRMAPPTTLWPLPSPYDFNDLSRYSFLVPPETTLTPVGDNAACAAYCDSTARLALLAPRADARDRRDTSARR